MQDGRAVELVGIEHDPDPSPIAGSMIGALEDPSRIAAPMARASFLEKGHLAGGKGRGVDPFIELEWPEAIDLAARELQRVRSQHGNSAIYGGSYGWGSAGRFHHAKSQVHRFLNAIGGCVRSVQDYSFAAASTILPYVIGTTHGLGTGHTVWPSIINNTQTVVMFGGAPHKNAQVNSGGVFAHYLISSMKQLRKNGAQIVCISPIRDDAGSETNAQWLPVRPGTDVALMLGLAHTLMDEGLHDVEFLKKYTSGFKRFAAYVTGEADGIPKSADWAAKICAIPAHTLRQLARRMATTRTKIMMAWSLQRANYGEQPCWMAITLAAMLGQIGLPGGGFGFGYGASNGVGNPLLDISWPALDQGQNAVDNFIPVARISDMLLNPKSKYDFKGQVRIYPDIKLVYWAGGNPFHHHQDLNRLCEAWTRPEVVIVHDSWWNALARRADIVFPSATQLERNDIACAARERMLAASHKIAEPFGKARADFDIYADLCTAMDVRDIFTKGRDEEEWLRALYQQAAARLKDLGHYAPHFDDFWEKGLLHFPEPEVHTVLLEDFRRDPQKNPLQTASGLIEIYSETIAGYGYADCSGHPRWFEPLEWLGSAITRRFPLHMISNQPKTRLHSQYDNGQYSRDSKIQDREPVRINPDDASKRGIGNGDVVRIFNDRGECLAGVILSDAVRPGVVQLSTGAWYDPQHPGQKNSLDKHGNPNVLTADRGTSKLSQATSAHSCLVEIELFTGTLPPLSAFDPPRIVSA